MEDAGTTADDATASTQPEEVPTWATSDTPPARRRAIRILLGVVVVAMVGVWAFALYQGSRGLPDLLDDPEIAAQAEQICSVAVATNKALPPAYDMETAEQRADVLEQSNVALAAMVDQLDQIEPATARDISMWDIWVGDWRTYVGDRARFVQGLRDDPNTRFNVTMKDKDQVTEPIDRFARNNRMHSCGTPQDLG